MNAPAVGAVITWTPSLEHAARTAAPSSAGMIRILVMTGLRLSDPDWLRVVVQLVGTDGSQRRKVPHVFGVVTRPDALRDLAVVVREEIRCRIKTRVHLRSSDR